MKRTIGALALSAFTLVGGHLYNRRWDRAVLFFVALVLWGSAFYVYAMMSGFQSIRWSALWYGSISIWIASLAVAFSDARYIGVSTKPPFTTSGAVAAVGLSILSLLFLLMPAMPVMIMMSLAFMASTRDGSPSQSYTYRDTHFSNYIYLGRVKGAWDGFPKPPAGDGNLRGRFTYEGKPASGVRVSLVLNGKYETEQVTTDDNGIFTVRLPAGEWWVNRVATHEWADRPKGKNEFFIVSGTEPKLVGGRYNEHFWLEREGVQLTITEQPSEPQLNFIIRNPVHMTWPGKGEKSAKTTLKEAVVKWEPYPGAETYLVEITELKREGRSTALLPVTKRPVVGATSIALANLQAAPGDEEKEYQAEVRAFAADGTLLSQSAERFSDRTFVLTDKQQLVRADEQRLLSGSASAVDIEALRANSRRIEAIEVLVKDGMLNEAEKLLANVKEQTDPGKKAAIQGYLLAKRGRCAEAIKLFAQARAEAGRSCVPDYYEVACVK